MNQHFSFCKGGIKSHTPDSDIGIENAFALINSDTYKEQILSIRTTTDKRLQSQQKSKLDYFIFSGTFSTRKAAGLISHSGLICLDFDNIENVEEVKKKIYANEFVVLGFVSPSGNGLKIIVRINITDNAAAWQQLFEYFKQKYTIEADKSGKDVCRACFVSYDTTAYFNSNAKVFEVKKVKQAPLFENWQSELTRAKRVVERITDERIDITDNYNAWVNIGFALATFGEDGRELFHLTSQMNAQYNSEDTNKKFDNLLTTGRFTSPAYFFKRAKECGVTITKNQNAQPETQVIKNEETYTNGIVTYDLQDYQILIRAGQSRIVVAEGFLLYIKYQTTDENEQYTWVLELRVPDGNPIYIEVTHDDLFEPKSLEKILGAKRLSMSINYQQLQKLRTFLFTCTKFPNAIKVLRYGLHPATELYFFANCAITKTGEILHPDSFGILKYQDIYLSVPQVNRGQVSPFTYVDNHVTFDEWYLLFSKAQREEMTFLSTSFMLFSLFRDIGIKENGFSPMLYIYGIAGTAKSTLFLHLNYIFGTDGKAMGVNLKGRNTEPAFVAKIEQRHNGYQFGDEYKPNHPLTPLFQASYDNKAYSKMNMSSKGYLDTTDLVPKCTIGFASNFLPDLPNDEPFFSRLVMLVNNNRNRTEEQKKAFRELLVMQEKGITSIVCEIWQYRDLIKKEFRKNYHLLKNALEKHFESHQIGNPRYFYNIAQILTVPYILSIHGKIALCEATNEQDLLTEFINRSETSILISERLVQEKSALREFFDCIQELFDKGQIYESVHYRLENQDIIINLQRLYQKFVGEFKKQNRFELQPPSIQTLQDEILAILGLDSQSEEVRNNFFRKLRFTNEIERNKTDFIRNSFKINYLFLQNTFGLDFTFYRTDSKK
ncbi:BT4734/BF3469 family protein [Emticicia sp. W12TSBA100-4]|uniref:BT4734/BF3469 family protein n=1 Tax=Emticicia sp. W12TSBA100-4 TaxID=3160965 RepID=UPI00330571DF